MDHLIRIVLVGDYALARSALAYFLNATGSMIVVEDVGHGEEATDAVWVAKPDVVLIDCTPSSWHAPQVIAQLLRASPNSRVVLICDADGHADLKNLPPDGAVECIHKNSQPHALLDAIRRAVGR
jgi:DNA-binding NarL/FixJ family response regulator